MARLKASNSSVQTHRMQGAVVIVAGIVLVIILVCAFSQRSAQGLTDSNGAMSDTSTYAERLTNVVISGAEMSDELREAGFIVIDEDTAPPWFSEEVFPVDELTDGVATSDWSTVGFTVADGVAGAFEYVSAMLIEKGWLGYASGIEGTATFTKEKGVCSWMMVSCVDAGNSTSVVLSLQHQ